MEQKKNETHELLNLWDCQKAKVKKETQFVGKVGIITAVIVGIGSFILGVITGINM